MSITWMAKPRVFDAKIFDNDDTHPGLARYWGGTILVVGMRSGGGPMTIDTGGNGLGNSPDATRRSAFAIFDITDPESEPRLLGEIQLPDGSYTVSYPTTMTFKGLPTDSDPNKWYLLFGSGPDDFVRGESTSTAKMYIFDMHEFTDPGSTSQHPVDCKIDTLGSSMTSMKIIECDTGVADSFVGTPITVDWDLDFKADSVYFGLIGGTTDTPTGQLMRLNVAADDDPTGWTKPTTLIDVDQPVSAAPTAGVDDLDNKWLFFGTGRLLTSDDKSSTAYQSLYGVKDDGSLASKDNDLVDVSKLYATTDGDVIYDDEGDYCTTGDETYYSNAAALQAVQIDTTDFTSGTAFDYLESRIDTNWRGWKLNLPPIVNKDCSLIHPPDPPATRMVDQQALLGAILFSSVYQPSLDQCSTEGLSQLYGLYFKTGTALPSPTVFGTSAFVNPSGETLTLSKRSIDLGIGLATSPAIHSGTGEGNYEVSVFTQLSTGTIIRSEASTKEKVRSGKQAWKER